MNKKSFNRKIIGKNVKNKRSEEHLTQAQLAEMADMSVVHLSHIENGSVNMSLKVLHRLCNIFLCTPNDILLGTDYNGENYDKPFMDGGLNPEDQELLQQVSKLLRKRHKDEKPDEELDTTPDQQSESEPL